MAKRITGKMRDEIPLLSMRLEKPLMGRALRPVFQNIGPINLGSEIKPSFDNHLSPLE
jgi:hypothetical protein